MIGVYDYTVLATYLSLAFGVSFNSHAKKTNGLSAVGIPNVKERLELYYGTQGGMEYVSSGNGTEVTVFLPAIYDMPEEGRKN